MERALIRLCDLPGISDVERLASARGGMWREDDPDRVALTDRVSVSLFGITEGDTYRPEPNFVDFLEPAERARFERSQAFSVSMFPKAQAAYDKACDDAYAWEDHFNILYDERIADEDREAYWRVLGIDPTNGHDDDLNCFHAFSRQLIVVARGLLPGAKLTADGSGTRASPDAETWGRALEAAAREFAAKKKS